MFLSLRLECLRLCALECTFVGTGASRVPLLLAMLCELFSIIIMRFADELSVKSDSSGLLNEPLAEAASVPAKFVLFARLVAAPFAPPPLLSFELITCSSLDVMPAWSASNSSLNFCSSWSSFFKYFSICFNFFSVTTQV